MLYVSLGFALALLLALGFVGVRARDYVRRHPELTADGTPPTYQLCQHTLDRVIARYRVIENDVSPGMVIAWQSPNGFVYTVSGDGVQERRENSGGRLYALAWPEIGGVGIRMQPGFKVLDQNRDGWADKQITTGYSFHLLIVPRTGSTINIWIPTNDRADAVDFVAHTLALARQMRKRINVFGFDKPPAPARQRVSRI